MAREDVSTATTGFWVDRETRQLIVERTFGAPRDLVWKAFTEPERIEKWWGPREWKTVNKKMEVKPGGVWHYCMTGPDGTESWGKAVYQEISPQDRIVYADAFSDAEGNTNESMPTMVITMEFQDLSGRTKVSSVTELASAEQIDSLIGMGMVQGLSETWDRLEEFLAQS